MNCNLVSFDLSVLDISLVANKTNWNIWSNFDKVIEPFQNILIGFSACKIEHDYSAMRTNIITFSELTELFLSSCIPDLDSDLSMSSIEDYLSNASSFGWNVDLNQMTSVISLDKGCLSDSTVSDQN